MTNRVLRFSWPPAALVGALMLGVVLAPAAARATDCDRAESLLVEAKQVAAAAQRIDLLEQARRLCPSYTVDYDLGKAYARAGRLAEAKRQFQSAREAAATKTQDAKALARLADLALMRGDIATAQQFIEAAMLRFDKPPKWALAIRKDIDRAFARGAISADTIASTLAGKGVHVCPRIQLNVLFDYDSAHLKEVGKRQTRELGKALSRVASKGKDDFLIIGHTDRHGSVDYNLGLSKRRAAAVYRAVLADHPELRGRIAYRGCGESQLRYKGEDKESDRLNRRVEVRVDRPACERRGQGACS